MKIKQQILCELARREFYYYCKVLYPAFYKDSRPYLKDLCDELQDFYYNDNEFMIVNLPPRHGKSFTATNLIEWIFGKNPIEKVISGSYNEDLSKSFSKKVRNTIDTEKVGENIVYSDIFPNTKIKFGSAEAKKWQTDQSTQLNYLATSPTGTATGFGATIEVIDDLVKNSMEANNLGVLEKQWDWFCFESETKVNTKQGYKKIKDIEIGDKVLSYNHSQCIIEEKEVVRTNNKLSNIYRLEFENGKIIETTGNHKFYTNKGYKTVEEILRCMWRTLEEGETVLFKNLFQQGEKAETRNNKMPILSKGDKYREKEQTEKILFYKMSSSIQDKKFTFKIYNVEQSQRRSKIKIQEMSKMWKRTKFACSSCRSQRKKQRFRKFNSIMSILPLELSQATRLPRNDFRRVYDIEIKDNHNFFVDDILVHNCNTMLSRREGKKKVLIIMTRWSSNDLAGRILDYVKEKGLSYSHINLKAYEEETGQMLCEDIFNREDYENAMSIMGKDIFSANYQQIPIDLEGVLYERLQEYEYLPNDIRVIENYTDTADTGADYLASINYAVDKQGNAYVLDILYTKDSMEVTEKQLAQMLLKDNVNYCRIESNNGGRGFSRNVERITRDLGNSTTIFRPFHQSNNKEARIYSNSTGVMNNIYFPKGWNIRFKEAYQHLTTFQREGKNLHDDIEDAITGVNETLQKKYKKKNKSFYE